MNIIKNQDSCEFIFYDCCLNNGLQQLIHVPAYLNSSNTLDLVLTNDPGSIFNLQVIEPFSTSDHASVIYDMYFHLSSSNSTEHSTDFKKGNYDLLNNCLTSTDWTAFFQTQTVNECLRFLVPSYANIF